MYLNTMIASLSPNVDGYETHVRTADREQELQISSILQTVIPTGTLVNTQLTLFHSLL